MSLEEKNKKKLKKENQIQDKKWFHCFQCKQSLEMKQLGYVHYDISGVDRFICFSCAKTRFI